MSLSEILGSRIRQWGLSPDELDWQLGRWAQFQDDFVQKAGATLQIPWTVRTAGTPTAGTYVTGTGAAAFDGVFRSALASTNEAELNGIDWADCLSINEDGKGLFAWRVKFTAGGALTSTDTAVFGLGSAYNATLDNMTNNLWFRLTSAGGNWYCESDDGTTDNDDKDTGVAATDATYYLLIIDMSDVADCKFYIGTIGTGQTALTIKRVCKTTTFDMSGAGGLQPVAYVQKAASTRTHSIDIDAFRARWRRRGCE